MKVYNTRHLLDDPVAYINDNAPRLDRIPNVLELVARLDKILRHGIRCSVNMTLQFSYGTAYSHRNFVELHPSDETSTSDVHLYFWNEHDVIVGKMALYMGHLKEQHPVAFALNYVPLDRLPIVHDLWLCRRALMVMTEPWRYIDDLWYALREYLFNVLLAKASAHHNLYYATRTVEEAVQWQERLTVNQKRVGLDSAIMAPITIDHMDAECYCDDHRYFQSGFVCSNSVTTMNTISITLQETSVTPDVRAMLPRDHNCISIRSTNVVCTNPTKRQKRG
jgi:hypothetical protein